MAKVVERGVVIEDPPLARLLFGNTRVAWVWMIVRLYVGFQWLEAVPHKLSDPGWMQTGLALKGYWERATAIPAKGPAPISFPWYREFLQYLLATHSYTWFAKLVVVAEIAIGAALILGVFVGISAFFGAFMNWNFMMAGTASINPVLLPLALFLILAWKTAGYIGLDYYLLPMLGTPWKPGRFFGGSRRSHPVTA